MWYTIKNILKKILLKINPVYRAVHGSKNQLDNLLETVHENKHQLDNLLEIENKNKLELENIVLHFCKDDKTYLHSDVPPIKLAQIDYLASLTNKKNMKILEIGSRNVTGNNNFRSKFSEAEYVGFDFYLGENVDIVGDAHKLSSYFDKNEKFDAIFSVAVFEHFAMPWVVVNEISKLLKIGGLVLTATHFSFSSHERPWHFFQFSDMALRVLFSPAMGFECIDAGMGMPMVGRFSSIGVAETHKNLPVTGLYCSAHHLGKKIKDIENFKWDSINLLDVVGETKYPEPIKN